jgi:hypothetical protein
MSSFPKNENVSLPPCTAFSRETHHKDKDVANFNKFKQIKHIEGFQMSFDDLWIQNQIKYTTSLIRNSVVFPKLQLECLNKHSITCMQQQFTFILIPDLIMHTMYQILSCQKHKTCRAYQYIPDIIQRKDSVIAGRLLPLRHDTTSLLPLRNDAATPRAHGALQNLKELNNVAQLKTYYRRKHD